MYTHILVKFQMLKKNTFMFHQQKCGFFFFLQKSGN